MQDAERGLEQHELVDLEQLVARIGVENMLQRLAVMAVRFETRLLKAVPHLVAEDGNRMRRMAVGGRREQSDDQFLADDFAVRIEGFDDDRVERGRAMDRRFP